MRLTPVQKRNCQRRRGFTLVELLVVITIIAILMALTVGVISKVYAYLDESKVKADIDRMVQGCEQFKSVFGRYPPGKIILCEQAAQLNQIISGALPPPPGSGYIGATGLAQWQQLGAFTAEYLGSIFPSIDLTQNRDWNGNGAIDSFALLEGQHCLVYFLGGVRYGTATGGTGFNTDKTNPTLQTNGARLGPFVEFEPARLDTTTAYATYKDQYGTTYAYFAAKTQGLNNYANAYLPAGLSAPNDCHSLTTTGTVYFVPYFQSTVPPVLPAGWPAATSFKFHKGDTFQIVSAGKDKQFGTGGQYNQADPEQSLFIPQSLLPAVTTEMLQANYDNITNVTNGRVVPK